MSRANSEVPTVPHDNEDFRFSPLSPGGEGPRVRGKATFPTQESSGSGQAQTPHPQPLSPRGRGEEEQELVDLLLEPDILPMAKFDHRLDVSVKRQRLLDNRPWVRGLGNLEMSIQTEGWKFPAPPTRVCCVRRW